MRVDDYYRKDRDTLTCERNLLSYDMKNALRKMRTSRKGNNRFAIPLGRESMRQAHTLFLADFFEIFREFAYNIAAGTETVIQVVVQTIL